MSLYLLIFLGTLLLQGEASIDLAEIERERVLTAAEEYLDDEPVTITSFVCERSEGGRHDYYSEGDYWWPNPEDPEGPYIRKDGMTNPGNFTKHRKLLRSMSIKVAALAAAYKLTGEKKCADSALKHLKAWFVISKTRMNPSLLYAQAIKGRVTGRGIGIIDTIHLVEVAQAILVLTKMDGISSEDSDSLKKWFQEYLNWMTTHQFGIDERDNGNNHSTCWAMQVAAFAKLTGDEKQLQYCRDMYRETLIPEQMDKDGSFPKEIKRTKPYGYSLFNLDAMAMVCHIASTGEENLWEYKTDDGRGIKKGVEFLYPYIADKDKWPYQKDVMYFDEWPVRHPLLLLAGLEYNNEDYLTTWGRLDADPTTEEIIRNFPIRQPILWIED